VSEFPAPPPQPQPGFQSASGPSGPRAGFWQRFAAAFIDGLLLGIPLGVIEAIIGTNRAIDSAIGVVAGIVYFGFFEGSTSGQTVGKRAIGIRVIDFNTGGPIGFGRAVIRFFGRYISLIACLLGYFWMLWDKERQTWHDKLASDVVVPVSSYPVSSWPN
jgi:uncharacterized RDD family membrane protein YckC